MWVMKIFAMNDLNIYISRFHNVVKVVNTKSGEHKAQFLILSTTERYHVHYLLLNYVTPVR